MLSTSRLCFACLLAANFISVEVSAATISSASCSQIDVQTAIDSASDGDTVLIPAGVCTWTAQVLINYKAITLKGAGVMANGLSAAALEKLGPGTPTETVIIQGITTGIPMFLIRHTNLTKVLRVTGIRLKGIVGSAGINGGGGIKILTTADLKNAPPFRLDHLMFENIKIRPIFVNAYTGGVIDHCVFEQDGAAGEDGMQFDGRAPDVNNKGHLSWATPVEWGTANAGIYIEDNYMHRAAGQRAITDGFTGARFVFRYNTVINLSAENHGTESTGIFRGTRAMEVYNNIFTTTVTAEYAVLFRSGTGVVFGNTVSGKYPGLMKMVNYRERDSCEPWGQANGANPWDQNSSTIFATGKHTGASAATALTDSTASWTTNKWVGYHLYNPAIGRGGEIVSNTPTSITVYNVSFPDRSLLTFNPGDTYEVRKITRTLDGVGQGQGDLLVGGSNSPKVDAEPVGWPHQIDDPVYYWNNTGITNVTKGGYYPIVEGRNYVNAPRPNYSPYTYPHPLTLVTGGTGVPSPPSGLKLKNIQ